MGNTEAVGKCLRGDVPQVNRVAVSFRTLMLPGVEHDGHSLFPGLLVFRVGQGRSVLAQDMSRADSRVRYVYMRVTTCHGDCCDKYRYEPAHLSENVLFHLFPYFIGSFTPRATPTLSRSAPFIIKSLFACQYSVHPPQHIIVLVTEMQAAQELLRVASCRSSYTQVAVMIAARITQGLYATPKP